MKQYTNIEIYTPTTESTVVEIETSKGYPNEIYAFDNMEEAINAYDMACYIATKKYMVKDLQGMIDDNLTLNEVKIGVALEMARQIGNKLKNL